MAETATASVFMSGRSQAVRIPKAFWLDASRVKIRRRGEDVILTPIKEEDPWAELKEVAGTFPEDFFREDENDFFRDRPVYEYPRMGLDEPWEHFEGRVRGYEELRAREYREWEKWKDWTSEKESKGAKSARTERVGKRS